MLLLEFIVHDALHQARFAHARVANNDQFEKVILRRQGSIVEHLKWYLLDLLYLTLLHYMRYDFFFWDFYCVNYLLEGPFLWSVGRFELEWLRQIKIKIIN